MFKKKNLLNTSLVKLILYRDSTSLHNILTKQTGSLSKVTKFLICELSIWAIKLGFSIELTLVSSYGRVSMKPDHCKIQIECLY